MPAFIQKNICMVIGIDVCHAAGKSIVGFAATTNKFFSDYYSDIFLQDKG